MSKKEAGLSVILKPRPGRMVRDPSTGKILPAEGERKTMAPYWRRRIACGDVMLVQRASSGAEETH